jgi:phosphatidate cytidylyltransferase
LSDPGSAGGSGVPSTSGEARRPGGANAARRPGAAGSADKPRSVFQAIGVGLLLAGIVVGTLLAGKTPFFVLAFLVVLLAQAELYAVLKAAGHSPIVVVGLICGAVLLIGTYQRGAPALALCVALPLPLLLLWSLTVPIDRARAVIGSTYFGIVYGPLLVGFAILLLRGPDGLVLTATVLGMTAWHDTWAYLLGRKVGRHPMARRTSPGKTWEGFLAGTLVTLAASCAVLPLIYPFDLLLALKLSLLLSFTTPIGDLAESLIKRDLGVKDMGSLVPGHGGFFDRIDGIIFNAPIAYFVLRVLHWAP